MSVAIPALIAYIYFVGLVDRLIVEIDSLGQKVVAHVASDGIVFGENDDDEEMDPDATRSKLSSKRVA